MKYGDFTFTSVIDRVIMIAKLERIIVVKTHMKHITGNFIMKIVLLKNLRDDTFITIHAKSAL